MSERTRPSRLLILLLAVAGVAFAHDNAPHFDAPQHGGVVLQASGHLHYELVASEGGKQLQVWLTDERRRPLAAAEVTDLVVEIGHPGNQVDQVDMRISDDGSYWVGAVRLNDPADIVRIGFTYQRTTASSSTKYEILLHPPKAPAKPPAKPRGQDHAA